MSKQDKKLGFWQRFFGPKNEVDSSQISKGDGIWEAFTGGGLSAGVAVTERSAMSVSAVYACVNLISGAIATMPLPIYERSRDGERKKIDHDLTPLLNEQPIDTMTAATFWEFGLTSKMLNGDQIALIHRSGARPIALEPFRKCDTEVKRNGSRLAYIFRDPETGRIRGTYDQDDVFHVPGPGFDGLNGMSQLKYALRNSAGIAIASDEYSATFFEQGARSDFALEYPQDSTKEQIEIIRETWSDRHGGLGKNHLPAILKGGVKLHELTMNAEDAQLITTRQFQVEDISRAFGVPPHMIGHTQKTTSWGSGVEQMSIGFVKYTLQSHLVKIEQEINRKLLRNDRYFAEFNTAGLERGDYKTRNEGYRVAIGRAGEPGWMTVNEVRKLENMPPIEGGDQLLTGDMNAGTQETTD